MKALLTAALLHDIARNDNDHAKAGAEKAKEILAKYNYNKYEIDFIAEVISAHSFSGMETPRNLEGMILSDADKIDALGALGIYRTAMYSGEHHRSIKDFIEHFHNKLLKLRYQLYTDEAKHVAEKRTAYMLDYLLRLDEEMKFMN